MLKKDERNIEKPGRGWKLNVSALSSTPEKSLPFKIKKQMGEQIVWEKQSQVPPVGADPAGQGQVLSSGLLRQKPRSETEKK